MTKTPHLNDWLKRLASLEKRRQSEVRHVRLEEAIETVKRHIHLLKEKAEWEAVASKILLECV